MKFTKIIYILLAHLAIICTAHATHNRAGEITYRQLDDLTIECTITTYTKGSSTNADRDSILVFWGDGSSSVVDRVNGMGSGEILGRDIKKNEYRTTHPYPGRGTYTISISDPNRVLDVKNIPNSVNVRFYLQTTLTLLNSQFQGFNSSVILLQPPIDIGCVNRVFEHNPNAFDPDGDSLVFELASPFEGRDSIVAGYELPNAIGPPINNDISFNTVTGEFTWSSPKEAGEYNIAIKIYEYRNGVLLNTIIRDMQIEIKECDNLPPAIVAPDELCVVAGQLITIPVIATDRDSMTDSILLTALGGPLTLAIGKATFSAPTNFAASPVNGTFEWQTNCNHISDQYYSVIFRAVDDGENDTGLTDLHTLRIKVVGPPPINLQAENTNDQVLLSWDKPYNCEKTVGDYFYAFSVWRRNGSRVFGLDTCRPGLEGRGYEIVEYNTKDSLNGNYVYLDIDTEKGKTYCYRVLAEFARKTPTGNPYNFVESLTSNEVCIQLSRDLPLILNVDVTKTDSNSGTIFLKWTKPLAEALDTLLRPGPYLYTLKRSIRGASNFMAVPGGQFTAARYSDPVDTMFTDLNLNTAEFSYDYMVDFSHGGQTNVFRTSEVASSVFLNVNSSDRQNTLIWEEIVPWENFAYNVYRQNTAGVFDQIGSTSDKSYVDIELTNGAEYCYYIEAEGTYGIKDLDFTLFNKSQQVCGVPLDTVPPCSPTLTVSNNCSDDENLAEEDFINELTWQDPFVKCPESTDLFLYKIYYASDANSPFTLIDSLDSSLPNRYFHQPQGSVAGCYKVTAVDSLGNESVLADEVCIDNCPLYILPNVFTPNGDGANDFFKPLKKRFIASIEMKVYNEWGVLVYQTEDADILWNGQNLRGKQLNDGTYFYYCKVFEKRARGVIQSVNVLEGFIELLNISN